MIAYPTPAESGFKFSALYTSCKQNLTLGLPPAEDSVALWRIVVLRNSSRLWMAGKVQNCLPKGPYNHISDAGEICLQSQHSLNLLGIPKGLAFP